MLERKGWHSAYNPQMNQRWKLCCGGWRATPVARSSSNVNNELCLRGQLCLVVGRRERQEQDRVLVISNGARLLPSLAEPKIIQDESKHCSASA